LNTKKPQRERCGFIIFAKSFSNTNIAKSINVKIERQSGIMKTF